MIRSIFLLFIFSLTSFCFCTTLDQFPDLGGLANFSHSKTVHDTLLILTNPKSGSHLLCYSLMKITKRPMRGRLILDHFLHDTACFAPENVMDYPLDFTQPTTYFGHEYTLLMKLNRNRNKLIFIDRDYKENLCSQILVTHRISPSLLEETLWKEITEEGPIFTDFISRLEVFDMWEPSHRCLILFEDLVHHPERFVPQVLSFIEDSSDSTEFIRNYNVFKHDLMQKYSLKQNRTESGSNTKFFRRFLSEEILHAIDDHMAKKYPHLWNRYLQRYKEKD